MAIYQRKQSNILLTFKVLQFVNQLRRRVKPRTLDGSTSLCQLGSDALGLRAFKGISSGPSRSSVRNARLLHCSPRRARKSRKNNARVHGTSFSARATECHVSAASDAAGEQVQQIIGAVDSHSPAGCTLSTVASNSELFLKHSNAPIFEGYSLNQIIQLLVTVREALGTFAACRLQYGDDWLTAQGVHLGLDIDELFIANYEHLLLRLQAELTHALARKALEELLRGGHDKRQRKLLSCLSEFADKPMPLSTSFPWTIKPSLAVLWGVCWMFYDRDSNDRAAKAGNRVRQDRMLQHLDPSYVQWSAPASSAYVDFGRALIGATPQHNTQQASPTMAAAFDGVFEARNTDSWDSDLSPLGFTRLPSHEDVGANGPPRFTRAPPQLPGSSTYYQDDLQLFPAVLHDNSYSPHNSGSPLNLYSQLGADGNLNQPWPLPYGSLPHRSPRHPLPTQRQTPDIRVTGPVGSEGAQPQQEFAAFDIYQPQAPLRQLNTNFNYTNLYNNMSQISPDTTTVQVAHVPIKHERTSSINSNSNMPTPVSMSGQRSPMLSPTSDNRPQIATSPIRHIRRISEDRSSQEGDDDDNASRKNYSFKRAEEPPRNSEGKLTCVHQDCTGLFFERKCEWSKHMDKHDRPYKCNVKGCEKLQGFTYSGGLLRHEREVHKMHGGTKKSLFCPFNDCKRSSGAGFTRKENLAEHIRRVHRRTSMSADMHGLIIRRETMDGSPFAESRHTSESPHTRTVDFREDDELPPLKRKRESESGLSDRDSEDLRSEVKRLRLENEEKDLRLRQLENAVMALQHSTRR